MASEGEPIIADNQSSSAANYELIASDIDPMTMAVNAIRDVRPYITEVAEKAEENISIGKVIQIDEFVPNAYPESSSDQPDISSPDVDNNTRGAALQEIPLSIKRQIQQGKLDDSALFERIANGDISSRDVLFQKYIPLVRKLAYKYTTGQEYYDDVSQVASIGLLLAIKRFDINRGVSFMSFAYPTIEGEIKRYMRANSWGTHVPRRLQERALIVRKVVKEQESTRQNCSAQSIADKLGISYREAVEAMLVMQEGNQPMSFDQPIDIEDDVTDKTLADVTPAPNDQNTIIDKLVLKMEIERMLSKFHPIKREMFKRYFFLDQTQKEIAKALSLSQNQVSQSLAKMTSSMNISDDFNIDQAA